MQFKQVSRSLILFFCFLAVLIPQLNAQKDTTENFIDTLLLRQKGLLGKLAKNIMADKTIAPSVPVRNDLNLARWRGKKIRKITIKRLDFGTTITDTSRRFSNTLTRWANALHHKTREDVIRNNLFFKPGDVLIPELLSDNERHLRDLDYIQDADIKIEKVIRDSVDIVILTKDVLSIGGGYRMHSTKRMSMSFFEDNFAGLGHRFSLQNLFDNERNPKFGYGGEYTSRNIKGSFVDWYGGFLSFNKNINTGRQNEQMIFTGILRPLVNPYMKFTYAAEFADHRTFDVYPDDSSYITDHNYGFKNYDAWIGWNSGAFKIFGYNPDNRLRTLVGIRVLKNDFEKVPLKFSSQYNYLYADIEAALASVSVFRQDYYKTQYVYGLGRNEDIPEGLDVSFTAGWTKKANVQRPYIGLNMQRYFFTVTESYFNYGLKAGAYLHNSRMEDINLLVNMDYFSRLRQVGASWKLRNFISSSVAYQPRLVLNEPLFLQSDFGLKEWRSDTTLLGKTRATIKAESVFFTPWRLANFRFAPFVFTNVSFFTPLEKKYLQPDIYSSIGAGLRIRNESLIFEAVELRAFFFPKQNFMGDHFRVEFNSHIRFKYNRQFIKKPDFVNMNGT
jgi:hypothetical protein